MTTWNPAREYQQEAEVLPITAPPCQNCANWRPTRQHGSRGEYLGVRLCQAEEMWVDFSCFTAKENQAEATVSP